MLTISHDIEGAGSVRARKDTLNHRFLRIGTPVVTVRHADPQANLTSVGSRLRRHWVRRLEAAFIKSTIGSTASMAVLDVGCGPGFVTLGAIDPATGLLCLADVDIGATKGARADAMKLAPLARVESIICRGEQLPFNDNSFDTILMVSSLEHFEDEPAALAECSRVIRPGGRILITTDGQPSEPGLPVIRLFAPLFRPSVRTRLKKGENFLGAVLAEHGRLYAVRRRHGEQSLRIALSLAGFDVTVSQTLIKSRFSKALDELCVTASVLSFDIANPLFRFVSKLYPVVVSSEAATERPDGYVIAVAAVSIKA